MLQKNYANEKNNLLFTIMMLMFIPCFFLIIYNYILGGENAQQVELLIFFAVDSIFPKRITQR